MTTVWRMSVAVWATVGSITCLETFSFSPLPPRLSGTSSSWSSVTLSIATGPLAVAAAGLGAADPRAAVGERVVGVGHLERGDARLEAAEDHRRVVVEPGVDARSRGRS